MGATVYCVGVKNFKENQVILNGEPSATLEPS